MPLLRRRRRPPLLTRHPGVRRVRLQHARKLAEQVRLVWILRLLPLGLGLGWDEGEGEGEGEGESESESEGEG